MISWRKKYKEMIGVIGIASVILIHRLFSLTILSKEEIGADILLITALILLWYTKETSDLKMISQKGLKETRKNSFLATTPFLRLQWGRHDEEKHRYRIRVINEGNGVALDIELIFSNSDNVARRSMMASEKAFRAYSDIDDEEMKMERTAFHGRFVPIENFYQVSINYKDILGNVFFQQFVTDKRVPDGYSLLIWKMPEGFTQLLTKGGDDSSG